MDKYPTISLTQLQKINSILETASSEPNYFKSDECPYDAKTKKILQSWAENPVVAATVVGEARGQVGRPKKTTNITTQELEAALKEIVDEIAELKRDSRGMESHERVQVAKLQMAVLEKKLAIKESIINIKNIEKFTSVVLQLMEDHCTEEGRDKIIEALAEYRED